MSEKSVVDVLNEAAEIVNQGWCQNGFARRQSGEYVTFVDARPCDRFCLDGAVRFAAGLRDADAPCPALKWLQRALNALDETDVWDWNDARGRTQADVVAKLREAAALAAQEATFHA